MRSRNHLILLCLILLCSACNMPSIKEGYSPETGPKEHIWDLSRAVPLSPEKNSTTDKPSVYRTPTPQLYKPVDFDLAFKTAASEYDTPSFQKAASGEDRAEWLFFDPAEYSSASLDTLYTAFTNTGESTWTDKYYLEFFAGNNPSSKDQIYLDTFAAPGDRGMFSIPISSDQPSWKSCWYLKNDRGESFYEFCYNHGTGANINSPQSAQNTSSSSSGFDPSHPFYKFSGSAPAKFSNSELSADFVSTSPKSGHTFKAYDHTETLTVTFKNNGSETWDNSYSLVFYSGYNWMHVNSFALQGTAAQGETAVFSLPIEIYEDNDKWETCWYLASPDGKNLSDFCFSYYTGS